MQDSTMQSLSVFAVIGRYSGAPLGTLLFLFIRWILTPYSKMEKPLPKTGKILDLGCGHGLLALMLALKSPSRQVIGVDHDKDRLSLAKKAAQGLTNLEFCNLDIRSLTPNSVSGITLIDVLHYLELNEQDALLKSAFDTLEPGGVLVAREVDPEGGATSAWNRLYEKIATTVGFTKSQNKALYFRKRGEWVEAIKKAGFDAKHYPCSSALFADVLFVGRKVKKILTEP